MIKVLIIIPAYNEQDSILGVIADIQKAKQRKQYSYSIDYVVINDCSKDSTLSILVNEHISYINLPINLGIGGGMQTGYKYALENGYDVALQVDGDGQHDVSYIEDLVQPIIQSKADIVIGSRFIEKNGFQSTGLRRLGISWLSLLIRLISKTKVKDVTSGYRAVGRSVMKAFSIDYAQDYPEPESIVMCAKKGYKVLEIPVVMKERSGGVSSISHLKSVYSMIKVSLAILFAGIIYKKNN